MRRGRNKTHTWQIIRARSFTQIMHWFCLIRACVCVLAKSIYIRSQHIVIQMYANSNSKRACKTNRINHTSLFFFRLFFSLLFLQIFTHTYELSKFVVWKFPHLFTYLSTTCNRCHLLSCCSLTLTRCDLSVWIECVVKNSHINTCPFLFRYACYNDGAFISNCH